MDELLSVATKAAKLGIHHYNVKSQEIIWDERVREIWGIDPDEPITYEIFMSQIHLDDKEKTQQAVNKSLEPDGNGEYYAEYRVINRKDQKTRWIASTGQTFFENNKPFRLIGTVQEITLNKELEEGLKKSEAKYRQIVETAQEGIWMIDEHDLTVFVNPKLCKMLGYGSEEIIGKSPRNFMAPEFVENAEERFLDHQKGNPHVIDHHFIKKDGSSFWCILSSTPILENGIFKGSLAMLTDITDRKKAEEELRQSETRFRMLHESLRDAFVQVDMEGHIIGFNKIFCEMLKYSPEELHQLKYQDLTPEHWHTYEQSIVNEQIIPLGYSQVYEKEYRRKDGTVFPVELRTILSTGKNGNPVSMWAIIQDITERKLAELKLKQQAEELIELNALKDKFFSILAHDLKNPFSLLLGASELMIDQLGKGESESAKRLAAVINKSAKNGLHILEDLMEWSKIQTGGVKFNLQKLNLRTEVENIVGDIDILAKSKKIGLKSEITENIEVFADKYMINVILRNLLENAIKFTPESGSVSIIAKQDHNFANIIVKDTGVGISHENIHKLFKLDGQFSTPGTAMEKGTGLGLLLCKEFVDKHRGKIWAESEVGKGSSFTFTINKDLRVN